MFARKVRGGRKASARLRVDELEPRDMPAAYWVGDFSTDATDARNWYPYNQPPAGDLWFYGSGSLYDEVEGEWIDRPLGASCYGLPGGSYGEVFVGAGYEGTITLDSDTAMLRLWMESGAIDQAGHDITVTGSSSPASAPADFYWTGGTLNSGATPATISIVGDQPNNQVTTALIALAGGGAVTTGSTLNFIAGATGVFLPGTVTFNNAANLIVDDGCTVDCQPGPTAAVTFASGTAGVGGPNNWIKPGGTITVTGPGSWANQTFPMLNEGGTFKVQGGATARFTGLIGPANEAASYRQTGASSRTLIECGSTVEVDSGMYLAAGRLTTVYKWLWDDDPATIDGDLVNTGADIAINDAAFNPPNTTGHQFGGAVLHVTGNVRWSGGVYRPYVSSNGIDSDVWRIDGTLIVSGGASGAKISLASDDALGEGLIGWTWEILNAADGITVPTGNALPPFDPAAQDDHWDLVPDTSVTLVVRWDVKWTG